MNILFVCVWNQFRSRMAEALFNHLNTDKTINVRSAGTKVGYPGGRILPEAEFVLREMNIPFDHNQGAVQITDELKEWADKIYVFADDAIIEDSDKVIRFEIPDSYSSPEETLRTFKKIEVYVKKIIEGL